MMGQEVLLHHLVCMTWSHASVVPKLESKVTLVVWKTSGNLLPKSFAGHQMGIFPLLQILLVSVGLERISSSFEAVEHWSLLSLGVFDWGALILSKPRHSWLDHLALPLRVILIIIFVLR